MPTLHFATLVSQPLEQVVAGFDQALFEQLAPPFPPVRLIRFDAIAPGGLVEVELNFLLFRQRWVSEITQVTREADRWSFVDEGRQLPFFLGRWRHRHAVERAGSGSRVIDEIEFDAPVSWLAPLIQPGLWSTFAYRGPIYQRVFGRPEPSA